MPAPAATRSALAGADAVRSRTGGGAASARASSAALGSCPAEAVTGGGAAGAGAADRKHGWGSFCRGRRRSQCALTEAV
jgi:hypothetical protein